MRPAATALACVLLCGGTFVHATEADRPAQPDEATPSGSPPDPQDKGHEKAAARTAYETGVGHFKAKRYADAIREFNKAYRVDPNPVLVFNMARAFEELKDYDSAIEFYRRYLEMAPEASDRPGVESALRTLELLQKRALEPAKVELSVTSVPDGSRVFLDGREVGATPLRTELPPGKHFVAVEQKGYARSSTEVNLQVGTPVSEHIDLVKVAAAPSSPEAEHTGNSTAGWILVGMGGALLVGAAVTGTLALQKDGELDGLQSESGGNEADFDATQDEGRTLALTTDGLLLGGAASVITGGVLLFTGGHDESSARAPLVRSQSLVGTYPPQ